MPTATVTWTFDSVDSETRHRRMATSDSVSPEESGNARWHQARRKLIELRGLKADWDGLGGEAPDPAVVDWAVDFLSAFRNRVATSPPDRIVLAPDGAVVLEWQSGSERVQAEFCEIGRVEWMYSRPHRDAIHWLESQEERYGELDWDTRAEHVAGGAASVYA